jgi:hypothetical protein
MRYYPEDKNGTEDLRELNAEPWMVECLKMNPEYLSWGVYEEYMATDEKSWASRIIKDSWTEFDFKLNNLNEIVNYYFEINRPSKPCKACDESGYNPETKQISDDYYDFKTAGRTRRWNRKLTEDEYQALMKFRGLTRNEAEKRAKGKGLGLDALDKSLLVETRAKRFKVWGRCQICNGKGYIFTEPKAKLGLMLWVLYPGKGCSRGIYIKEIKREELSGAITLLKIAAERNARRFSGL